MVADGGEREAGALQREGGGGGGHAAHGYVLRSLRPYLLTILQPRISIRPHHADL